MSPPDPSAVLPSPPPGPGPFSQELHELIVRFDDRPVRLGEILEATKERGYHALLVLIALPFIGPIPLPGFSIPFGVVVALIGFRLALHLPPWLPRRLLQRELPPHFLAKMLHGVSRIVAGLEFFLRPRLAFLPGWFVCQRVTGVLIAVSGLFLILPLPLPFSNSLPAWTVLFLAAGSLGGDGLFILAGGAAFLVSSGFFLLLALGGRQLVQHLVHLLAPRA